MSLSKELRDLRELQKKGFAFVVYVCKYRGHRYIPEISAVQHSPSGSIAGCSWQNCNYTQKELRQIEALLIENNIPYTMKT